MTGSRQGNEQGISRTAAEWAARMRADNVSDQDRSDHIQWLMASPDHAREYENMQLAWARTDIAHEYAVRRLQELELLDDAPPVRSRWRRPRLSWVVMSLWAAVLLLSVPTIMLWPGRGTEYHTPRGEQSTLKLADGSTLTLNTQSSVTVEVNILRRRVTVNGGEVLFNVAPDARRPFRVVSGSRTIVVVGTQFDVRRIAGHTMVSVARGVVALERPAAAADIYLKKGDRVSYTQNGDLGPLVKINPNEVASWSRGMLIFRSASVGEVVAELNRYYSDPILVSDPELAARKLTGVFLLKDRKKTLKLLQVSLNARSEAAANGSTLLAPAN